MALRPAVMYTPCYPFFREQTGDIFTFAHFEEGDIRTKTFNDAESGDKTDDDSVMPPLQQRKNACHGLW